MPSVLITGANRGLGVEWTRQYAGAGWRVYATCRFPEEADALQALASGSAKVSVHRLDVTSEEEVRAVATALGGEPLDVLVNNAGVYFEKFTEDRLGRLDYAPWEQTFRVNTLGAVRVTEALVENVARSERRLVVAVTSHMGSIAEIQSPGSYAYRSSKAALNAAMKGLAVELRPRGVGVLLLHPGWVRTRMGGPGAPLEAGVSVRGMRSLVEEFHLGESGRFLRYNGTEIPW